MQGENSMRSKQRMLLHVSFPLLLVLLIISIALNVMPSNAPGAYAAGVLLSQNHPVTASSVGGSTTGCCAAANAVDGSTSTRWASAPDIDPSWIYVDLGTAAQITEIKLIWDLSCATSYQLQTSND